ncbi:hypothetical protein NIES2107_64870 [Nostoc carneum NIES-2107]|nr:hypothetical protein NIES2107_64870 [Nostoc carneum NIES-2107]
MFRLNAEIQRTVKCYKENVPGAIAWFEQARKNRIVIAMSGEVVYTADGEAVTLAEMMRQFPMQQ